MSTEKLVNAVRYLRSNGGYFLTVIPVEGGFCVVGSFKDIGSYSSTVSYCASASDIDEAQEACTLGLANLVKFTEDAKPVKEVKQAAKPYAAPAGNGSVITLKGLKDPHWGKAKDLVKAAGYRFDKDSKDWIGGDPSELPEWLQKRAKGGKPAYKKPEPASEPVDDDLPPSFEDDDLQF
jgi:hypothetical protein